MSRQPDEQEDPGSSLCDEATGIEDAWEGLDAAGCGLGMWHLGLYHKSPNRATLPKERCDVAVIYNMSLFLTSPAKPSLQLEQPKFMRPFSNCNAQGRVDSQSLTNQKSFSHACVVPVYTCGFDTSSMEKHHFRTSDGWYFRYLLELSAQKPLTIQEHQARRCGKKFGKTTIFPCKPCCHKSLSRSSKPRLLRRTAALSNPIPRDSNIP